MSPRLVFGGLVATLLAVNALIVQKELLVRTGTPVLLRLAPVDPRSLIQGDYMRLRYEVSADAERADPRPPRDGKLVIRLDEHQVATFVRFHHGEPLAEGERLLRYRQRRRGAIRLGAEEFFFQEGLANRFSSARFGEVRLGSRGECVLVGLRAEERRPLGPGLQ